MFKNAEHIETSNLMVRNKIDFTVHIIESQSTSYIVHFSANNFSKIFRITVDRDESNEKLLSEFRKYITGLLSGVRDRNEQEELNILTVA